jgi:hypothetical protein
MTNSNFSKLVTEIEKTIPGQDAYKLANFVHFPCYALEEKDIQVLAVNIVLDELCPREALECYGSEI